MTLIPDAPSTTASHKPLYNIGVVTRMTGISMATLRAWERRYDFPEASRTAGGHRLYSEHDIIRLRWVKARIDEGMQTAQAIQALKHQESTGRSIEPVQQQIGTISLNTGTTSPTAEAYQAKIMAALIQKDLQQVDQIMAEALAASSPDDLIIEVIGPVISQIGDSWEAGKISVAAEHFATNYLRHRLLMWMVSGPPPLSIPPVVLACAPGEWHEGSLLMLGALLRRQRCPIVYLGQSVPLKDLSEFVKDIHPSAVILVAMTENPVKSLADWPLWLPEAASTGEPPICFGGRIFNTNPDWQKKIPGIFLGSTISQGIQKINALLS